MRLKKIALGAKIIRFHNFNTEQAIIFWNKIPFTVVPPQSFLIGEANSFFVECPLNEFPEMQLYCKVKVEITVWPDVKDEK